MAAAILPVLVLAVGLAMDATAVAAARGVAAPQVRVRDALLIAGTFGLFQALMPALGALAGDRFGERFARWDHWIAFVLLAGIGGKMLLDAWRAHRAAARGDASEAPAEAAPLGLRMVLVLGLATSIDALAAGVTLPLFGVPLGLAAATIGVVTFVLAAAGMYVGRFLGAQLGERLTIVGGVALVAMGAKILVEHTLS